MKSASEWREEWAKRECKLTDLVDAIQADARDGLEREHEGLVWHEREECRAVSAFVQAYDAWAQSPEHCAGPLFDAMVTARERVPEDIAQSVAGEHPGAGAAKEAAGEPITACPVGGGETSRPRFNVTDPLCARRLCGHTLSRHGDISPTDLALGGPMACRYATCKCCEFQATVSEQAPAPGPGQPPPIHCTAGDHEPDAMAVLVDGVCIHCWRDQARIANSQRDAAHEQVDEWKAAFKRAEARARDLRAACEQKQESLDARTADLRSATVSRDEFLRLLNGASDRCRALEAEINIAREEMPLVRTQEHADSPLVRLVQATVSMLFAAEADRDAARAELARVREAMPSAQLLREMADDVGRTTAARLRVMASRIEALGQRVTDGEPVVDGSRSGEVPKTRRDIFREYGIEYVPLPEAPTPDRAAVEEALRQARDEIRDGNAKAAVARLLRAVEELAKERR